MLQIRTVQIAFPTSARDVWACVTTQTQITAVILCEAFPDLWEELSKEDCALFYFFFPKLRRSLMTLTLDLFNFMLVIPVSAQSLGWGRGLQHPRVLQEQMPRCTLCQQGLAWRGCDLNPWHLKSWRNICFPYHTALRNYRKEKPTPERKLCVQFGGFFCAKACSGCSQTGNKCTVDFTDPFSWVSGSVTEVMLCWWPCRNWALSESRATLRSTVLTGEQ